MQRVAETLHVWAADRPNEITTSQELDFWTKFGGRGTASGVMVNAEEEALRANRLKLLSAIDEVLHRVADFSRIERQ